MEQTIDQKALAGRAAAGDREALDVLLQSVEDMVFNLSLRMLGMPQDAEDATQEVLIKVMTHLSSFRGESSFSTWVFRIATNHLQDYRKGLFAKAPLSFEAYAADIVSGREQEAPDLRGGVDTELLAEELKLSCTNVMLQCLDPESRCIYILGTMFRLDSRVAAQVLDLTPEAYRQRLSRIRKKMAAFLGEYCGLSGTGPCRCRRRVDYAVATHRIQPDHLSFHSMTPCAYEDLVRCAEAMEELDGLSQIFAGLPAYRAPARLSQSVRKLVASRPFSAVLEGGTPS